MALPGRKPYRTTGPAPASIGGQELSCKHCGNNSFLGRGMWVTATLRKVPGFGTGRVGGNAYICSSCGFLHWFVALDGVAAGGGEGGAEEAMGGGGSGDYDPYGGGGGDDYDPYADDDDY